MRIALGLLTVACSVMVLHCSAGLPYVCHGAIECGLEPDGGFEGGPDARPDVVPSGCDPAAAPKDAPACVANSFAVFVDGTAGADTNEGTKESPLKSIGVALTKLGSRSRVYVCEGTYAESVEITKTVSLFGGLACDWKTPGASSPKWTGAKSEFALRIAGVGDRITVDSFDITAKDGSKAGDSSIGVFVADSKDVVLSNLNVSAGRGVDGADFLQKPPATNAPTGATPATATGGAGGKSVCADGESIGGTGGTLGADDATAGAPALGGGQRGAGITDCAAGGSGLAGASGSKGDDSAPLTTLGVLTSAGWTPSPGGRGKNAGRAQGGGGGGARAAAGGGGGAGGCGGTGGDPGAGGGASFALAVVASKVSLSGSKLSSGPAGAGGGGAAGQLGQPPGGGGGGGVGAPFKGCDGGQGGSGGQAGAGGGGAGGIAPAVLTKAGASFLKDVASTLTPGAPGVKGKGAGASNDGPAAPAAPTLEIP